MGRFAAQIVGSLREEIRCYKPHSFTSIRQAQFHHFSDASLYALGKTSYLRLVDSDGNITCSFVLRSLLVCKWTPSGITISRERTKKFFW